MTTKVFTIKEFAAEIGEDYITTSALVKVLVGAGAAKEVGKRANPEGQRGKPSVLFEIPSEVELVLFGGEEVAPESASEIEVENLPVCPTRLADAELAVG